MGFMDDAMDFAKTAGDKIGEVAHDTGDKIGEVAHDTGEKVSEKVDEVRSDIAEAHPDTDETKNEDETALPES